MLPSAPKPTGCSECSPISRSRASRPPLQRSANHTNRSMTSNRCWTGASSPNRIPASSLTSASPDHRRILRSLVRRLHAPDLPATHRDLIVGRRRHRRVLAGTLPRCWRGPGHDWLACQALEGVGAAGTEPALASDGWTLAVASRSRALRSGRGRPGWRRYRSRTASIDRSAGRTAARRAERPADQRRDADGRPTSTDRVGLLDSPPQLT